MREDISLPTLEDRRRRARLTMFYKVINNQIAIPIPDYITQRTRTTRSSQHQRFMRLSSTSDIYKHSFFSRTLRDWDALPQSIIELPSVEQFKEPSKPFKITAMDFYLHYNSTEYMYIHRTQLSEHLAQTASTVGSTAPHNPHPVAEQALMRIVIDVDVDVAIKSLFKNDF